MSRSIPAIFDAGVFRPLEPVDIAEGTRVEIQLEGAEASRAVDLTASGIDEQQATDLRQRLKTFADDWDRPDMDVYDAL